MNDPALRRDLEAALAGFAREASPGAGARALLGVLGYRSERRAEVDSVEAFAALLEEKKPPTKRQRELLGLWRSVDIVFQITGEEIGDRPGLFGDFDGGRAQSFLFVAADLDEHAWSRGELAEMTRAANRGFLMPVVLLFRHGGALTLAVVHRRTHKRDSHRDVLEKVTLVKDVRMAGAHRVHLDILAGLALPRLVAEEGVCNFDHLHAAWERALDIEALNRRFYGELFAWFERAVARCRFPDDGAGPGNAERHVIRLVTRLLFIWFLKEKGLVPDELFTEDFARQALKRHAPESGDYYRACLQNLFFATLNTGIERRRFSKGTRATHRDFHRYRYRRLLAHPDAFVARLKSVPFVNGGLFDCLDDFEGKRAGGRRIDAFTDSEAQGRCLHVPASLFFHDSGLFPLFRRYKFTVEENTPLDREVALDPELLGRVFENLLAAYNPETRATARKATGSYYTPRHIVDYMVGEALVAALAAKVAPADGDTQFQRDKLGYLLDWEDACGDAGELFEAGETRALVGAIAGLRVLDPAAGSGAFPMGVLHRLTLALGRLDPGNELWEALQKERAAAQAGEAFDVKEQEARDEELAEISRLFEAYRDSDFGRKLYLIQNGIFGADVQPIACQIAKLRFFISLVIEQERNDDPADNYGIRPLPNLETRFVAADALIGLGAGAQGDLTIGEVGGLEDELRRVRERHFNARNRQAKRRLREQDRQLRRQLADRLEKIGFTHASAEAVARWDPYDQNARAGWFDPEYMFGIADGFDVVIGNPPYIRGEKVPGKAGLAAAFGNFYRATADIYTYFFRRGADLLRQGGLLCYIVSNKFMRADYGEPLRAFLKQRLPPLFVLDFGRSGTFDATVRPLVLLARKGAAGETLRAATVRGGEDAAAPAVFMAKHGFAMKPADLADRGWALAEPALLALRRKIETAGTPLRDYLKGGIHWGIKTGLNEAFVIDAAARERLLAEDPASADLIRPWLRGRDVRRWRTNDAALYAIAIASSANVAWPWSSLGSDEAALAFKKAYPAIYRHLLPHEGKLRRRQDRGRFFWEWRSCAYYEAFARPKIVYPDIGTEMRALLDREGHITGNTCYIVPGGDACLLAILNSKLLDVWFRLSLSCLDDPFDGGDMRFFSADMEHAPIAPAPPATARRLATLAETIQTARQADPTADTQALEQEIDETVTTLYGLDKRDVATIEGITR